MKIRMLYGLSVCGFVWLGSCMADPRVSVTDVDPMGWSGGQPAEVAYQNSDTVSLSDLGVLLRYDRNLSAREISLLIETRSPDSLWSVDTVRFRIPPVTVRIDAEKNADFHETEQWFRSQARFPKTGTYRFRIIPMSDRSICGISATGIVLRPVNY